MWALGKQNVCMMAAACWGGGWATGPELPFRGPFPEPGRLALGQLRPLTGFSEGSVGMAEPAWPQGLLSG